MSTLDYGHGFLAHLPDTRPVDPVHAAAWDMLRMDRARLEAALSECLEPGAVRIVGRLTEDEALSQACRNRLSQLAGVAEPDPQLHLFRESSP